MSDYYTWEASFDSGNTGEWSAGEVSDVEARLSVDHYADLAVLFPQYPDAMPYRGAYALHGDLSIAGTADGYVQDTTLATALGGTVWIRFYVNVSPDLVMATNDRFTIAALQSVTPTDEAVICIRNVAGAYQIVASETSASATVVASPLTLGVWHLVELGVVVDSGGGDGTITFYLDGYQVGAAIATLTQAALIHLRLGIMGKDAGTTAGHVFFDSVVGGPVRVGGFRSRWEEVMSITKSGFVAVGPGRLDSYYLASGGGADNHLAIYDTDILPILAGADMLGPPAANAYPFETPYPQERKRYFTKGLYVQLSGTGPRGIFKMGGMIQSASEMAQIALRRTR